MKHILIIMFVLLSSCLTHKDLGQIKADMFEQSQLLIEEHKLEEYAKTQINRFFLMEWNKGAQYVELFDLKIAKILGTKKNVTTYHIDVVMTTDAEPYVRTSGTVEIVGFYEGIGQFTFLINPWVPSE